MTRLVPLSLSSTAQALRATLPSALVGIAVVAATFFLASPVRAAGVLDCDTVQEDELVMKCAQQDLASAQKRLDDAVSQTMASLPAAAKGLFEASHKSWVTYRDADCKWNAYDVGDGSLSQLILTTCLADLTMSRAEEVEAGVGAQ